MPNTIRAGRIAGDPLRGLCDRVCVQVDRVFDGCRETVNNQNFTLALDGVPPAAVPPFTFVSAEENGVAVTENVTVTRRQNGRACFEVDIVIPVIVTFTDANNAAYTATSSLKLHRSFILRVPNDALTPYRLQVYAIFRSDIGTFTSNTSVAVTACYALVAKVIVPTDLLIPTYGVCVYPACTGCNNDVCSALANLPLFSSL